MRAVTGYCPMGCGRTLNLRERDDRIICVWPECPRPDAVHEILAVEEIDHIVVLAVEDFSMEHPLRERLDGVLFDCPLNKWLSELDGPPYSPGRYRVSWDDAEGWCFEEG